MVNKKNRLKHSSLKTNIFYIIRVYGSNYLPTYIGRSNFRCVHKNFILELMCDYSYLQRTGHDAETNKQRQYYHIDNK